MRTILEFINKGHITEGPIKFTIYKRKPVKMGRRKGIVEWHYILIDSEEKFKYFKENSPTQVYSKYSLEKAEHKYPNSDKIMFVFPDPYSKSYVFFSDNDFSKDMLAYFKKTNMEIDIKDFTAEYWRENNLYNK